MRAIYKEIGTENIVVATCDDNMLPDDDTVFITEFTFSSLPDGSPLLSFIEANPMTSFRIHKVDLVGKQILLRSESDMLAHPYVDWSHKLKEVGQAPNAPVAVIPAAPNPGPNPPKLP